MKEKLLRLLQAKQEARTAKMKLVDGATDIEELRKLQKEVESIDAELRDIKHLLMPKPNCHLPMKMGPLGL